MLSARAVRRIVLAVCVVGIAGMIAGSVADDNDVALAFGLLTAVAVACLMVATAVGGGTGGTLDDEQPGASRAWWRTWWPAAPTRPGCGRSSPRPFASGGEAGAEVHGGRTPRPGGATFT